MEQYQKNLKDIIDKYGIKTVLELGVERGVSTKIFLKNCDRIISIDKDDCSEARMKLISLTPSYTLNDIYYLDNNYKWQLVYGDVSKVIRKLKKEFDLVFCDITYYTSVAEYGTVTAYTHEFKKLMADLPYYYKLVKEGGILVVNDYINENGQRSAVKDAFNRFMIKLNRPFIVYPTRGGMAVLEK